MRRYAGWLMVVVLLTLGGSYTGVVYHNSVKVGGGYEGGSGLSVQDDGTLLSSASLQGTQLKSTVATGTAPLVVASTTLVPNLHAAEADHAATADHATTAFDISDDTNLTASGGIVRTDDNLTHDTAAGYKHLPSGGSAGQALLSTGTSGTGAWADGTGSTVTPLAALSVGGGYASNSGTSIDNGGYIQTSHIVTANGLTLPVINGGTPTITVYENAYPSTHYGGITAGSLSALRSWRLPDVSGAFVLMPEDAASGTVPMSAGDGTYTWAAPDAVVVGHVETLTTAGGSGTAPVSNGAGGLAMTDIATEVELGTKANTAHSHLDAEVADALTVSGGTVNNTPIGATTASTGAFTTLTATGNPVFGTNTGASTQQAALNAAAGQTRVVSFQSAGVNRFRIGVNSTAESGSNAGSNFWILAYDDAGALIDTPFQISRVAGGAITLARPVTLSGTNNLTVGGNVDTAGVYQAGSGNVNLTNSTGNLLWAALQTPTVKETLILTSAGGEPTTTAGCAPSAKKETTTNKRNYRSLDFDAGTDESAFWNVTTLPENCPTGATFTVKVRWKAAGTGNVCWSVASVATSHDDPYDVALGTAVTGTVAVTAAGDEEVSSLGTMTPAGTLQAGDSLYVQLTRDADNASDTVSGDVEILGLSLDYTPRVN